MKDPYTVCPLIRSPSDFPLWCSHHLSIGTCDGLIRRFSAHNAYIMLKQIMAQIKMLTGVVEVGLFCHMAKAAYFGNEVRFCLNRDARRWLNPVVQNGSVTIRWDDGKVEVVQ